MTLARTSRTGLGVLAALMLGTTAAAAAACPGPDDVKTTGVWIEYADDWMTHTSATPKGTVIEVTHDGSEEPYWIESYGGVYVVADGNQKDGQILTDQTSTYVYPVPLDQLPTAAPGLLRVDQVGIDNTDTEDAPTGTQTVRVVADTTITVGACTYDSLLAHVSFDKADNDGYIYALHVLKGLDIIVLTATGSQGAGYDSYYKAVTISTERPRDDL